MNSKNYYLWLFVLLFLPTISFALVEPVYLVGIPGVNANLSFDSYINALYALSISIAALLAVIKIIIAGVKWMLSDIVTNKQEAKSDIWGATLGLLLVISAVLILGVINPQLTTTGIFLTPAANIGTNTPYISEGEAKCISTPGTWTDTTPGDTTDDAGYCTPKEAYIPPLEAYGCKNLNNGATDATGYECDPKDKKACEDKGGTVKYPAISPAGLEQWFKFQCKTD